MSEKINIAVIGTGRMGSVHVGNLVNRIPEANLVALCDIKLDVVQAGQTMGDQTSGSALSRSVGR